MSNFPESIIELLNKLNNVNIEKDLNDLKKALKSAIIMHSNSKKHFNFFSKVKTENREILRLTELFKKDCNKIEKEFAILEEYINTNNIEMLFKSFINIREASCLITESAASLEKEKKKIELLLHEKDGIKFEINLKEGSFVHEKASAQNRGFYSRAYTGDYKMLGNTYGHIKSHSSCREKNIWGSNGGTSNEYNFNNGLASYYKSNDYSMKHFHNIYHSSDRGERQIFPCSSNWYW